MRKFIILPVCIALFAGSVLAAQTEIDEDFMRSVEDANKSLSDNLASRDAKASTADATELQGLFAQVEAFYAAKGGDAADALALSKKSRDLSVEVARLVGAKDFDNAAAKANDITRACKSCHNFYKKS